MQTFIYKLLPKIRRGVEVDLYVILSTIQVGKEKLNLIQNPKEESGNKSLFGFLGTFRAGSGSFKEHSLICHYQGDYPECLPKSAEFVQNITDLK